MFHDTKPGALTLITILLLGGSPAVRAQDQQAIAFFEMKIRPVLVRHCYECHSVAADEPGGGLLLDSRPGIRKGGESGPAVVPFQVEESLLIAAIKHETVEMPPKKQLDNHLINDFTTWIQNGAHDPRETAPDAKNISRQIWEQTYQTGKQWWSFQPLAVVTPPVVRRNRWSHQPIDRFILQSLTNRSLQPAPPANRSVLIRRLAYGLTGLPPTPEQVNHFLNDHRRDAWQRLVDQYLASDHFGEHFARHWMDVVRYSDTYGYEWDIPAKGSWRYRDYLIRAFNSDLPFDQLIREQLAGDLLPDPRINEPRQINESQIGPMFYQLGEHRHGDSSSFEGIHQEMLDNKIDAFSKAFQGITVACARCHDHKLEPITQQEYYALAGVFMSSRWVSTTIDLPDRNNSAIQELRILKQQIRQTLARIWITDLQQNITPEALDSIQPEIPLPIGDINYPWNIIYKLPDDLLAAKWKELGQTLTAADDAAAKFNDTTFELLVDFSKGVPEDWHIDGSGLSQQVSSGDFQIHRGDEFIRTLFLPGLATSNLSARLNGALRSPLLSTMKTPFVSILAAGEQFSAFRRVVDNAFLCEKQTYYANPQYHWKVESTFKSEPDRRIFFEFTTKSSNPNFPPRVGLGGTLTAETIADPHSWFAVNKIYAHEATTPPKQRLTAFLHLLRSGTPQNKTAAANLYKQWLLNIVKAWRDNEMTDLQIGILNNLLQTPWITKSAQHPELTELVAEYRLVEATIQTPRTINSMADHDPGINYRLNIRGSYYDLGDPVPRGYLRLFATEDKTSLPFAASGSGRLRLAELVASSENPLTARVYVNRLWQWLFGNGIVETPSNFGKLGGKPSHPELLDWLAHRFILEGWSTKKLIRHILLTRTWQQSGDVSSAGLETDPTNRLLHHFPTQRLSAESIGDAMLAISGRLDDKLYGAPHDPYRTAEDEMKRLFSGPVDGNGRRMIYTKVTIMEPPKFLTTFNLPEPKIPIGKRDVTHTPAQALALLNHPFVLAIAAHWGKKVLTDAKRTPRNRLASMLTAAYSRPTTNSELDQWEHLLDDLVITRKSSPSAIMTDEQLWIDIAHTIFNTKEFIYLP